MTDDFPVLQFDHAPWTAQAACIGLTDLFFTTRGQDADQAKAVCATCPVIDECLAHGMSERHGVYGGKSEKQRRAMRRQRRQGPIPHGEPRGYQAHIRQGEEACQPCKDAIATYNASLKLVKGDAT